MFPGGPNRSVPFAEPPWYSRGQSPYYDQSHERLRAFVRKYVDDELRPNAESWEEQGEVPAEAFRRHAELGFLVMKSPDGIYSGDIALPGGIASEQWNGFHTLIVTDELTRVGYYGVLMGLGGGNSIGCPPILNFGSEQQKLRFLPKVARGEIRFCLGITEPDAGSDVSNIQTTAQREGQYFLVNGGKKWITNGIWAQYCTAAVRTGGPGFAGISLLIIPLEAAGVRMRRMHNSGVKASGSTFIEFDNVKVPVDNLIGKENSGFAIIMSNFNPERLALACSSLRLSRVCLEDAYRHSLVRETFGHNLISYGVIRAKFANMAALIEPAFSFMEQLIWLNDHSSKARQNANVDVGGMTALLKIMSTKCLELCAREAQQILGGSGYSRGGKGGRIEQISRDTRMFVVGGGSEEIMNELSLKREDILLHYQDSGKRASKL